MNPNKYSTLVEAFQELKKRGYRSSFKLQEKGMKCLTTEKIYQPENMKIVEYQRFEGATNPSDMSILFAVECDDGVKGTVISSYGTYADMKMVKFMDKVKIKEIEIEAA